MIPRKERDHSLRDAHQNFLEAIIILLSGIQEALTNRVGAGI